MLQTVENANGHVDELQAAGYRTPELQAQNGVLTNGKAELRRLSLLPFLPGQDGQQEYRDTRPVLAAFCYEDPDSAVGRFVTQSVSALAGRGIAVHLFSRRDFDLVAASVSTHILGDGAGDDPITSVQEFAGCACNAFLKLFQRTALPVTLMGFEWSAVPALSLLRGIKNLDVLLSLHSLERQRSDMTAEANGQIEKLELSGLWQAKTILIHDPASAEIARNLIPECAERIVPVPPVFPLEPFANQLDPGAVKARYQIGPIDPMILFVGDLDERYGPDLLVKALPAILKNHPQARLAIVGEGTLYWPLRVYTRYLLLEHAVRLVGHVEGQALHELIQAADVVAVPSREATPWWPIQAAWAAGRPVVATHQAAPGLLDHERDGVLVFPSENSCVWGIERVLFDAELRQTLANKGSEKLDERFGWSGVAAQVEELMTAPALQ
jgi:glycosyltransferase involved in cell wall biosynthesis